ncbi:unnamed protein product [Dicrocoelium dendriticum]|nr:unnamed protein product [Dicrocoelium dendriticum]
MTPPPPTTHPPRHHAFHAPLQTPSSIYLKIPPTPELPHPQATAAAPPLVLPPPHIRVLPISPRPHYTHYPNAPPPLPPIFHSRACMLRTQRELIHGGH